jgi:hypothetical protein
MTLDEVGEFAEWLGEQHAAQAEIADMIFRFLQQACPDEQVKRPGIARITVSGRLGDWEIQVGAASI